MGKKMTKKMTKAERRRRARQKRMIRNGIVFGGVAAICIVCLVMISVLNRPVEPQSTWYVEDGAMEIARRSRGTPRIANRMLRRVRDFAEVRADGVITRAVADEALRAHCRAVAALADELGRALREKGAPLDADALHAAALLHDIARGEPDHAALGARRLGALGYPGIAEIVRQHHELESAALDEAAVVYLADKAVRGARRVPIDERFAASAAKCTTPEAIEAHARRYAAARKWRDEINRLCGAELIR